MTGDREEGEKGKRKEEKEQTTLVINHVTEVVIMG